MVRALVTAHRRSGPKLAISTYGGVVAPPILYGRALFRSCARSKRELAARAWSGTTGGGGRAPMAAGDAHRPRFSEDVDRIRARLEAA